MSSSNFGSCAVPVIVARLTTTGTHTSSYPCSPVCTSRKRFMSERTSRAPAPRYTTKPDPLIFAPRARSMMPSVSAISQCGRRPGSVRGVPHSRTMTLHSSPPFGTSGKRDVRNLEHDALELRLRRRELGLEAADLLTERATLRNEIVRVLLRLLSSSDFLRGRVARRLSAPRPPGWSFDGRGRALRLDRSAGRSGRAFHAGASRRASTSIWSRSDLRSCIGRDQFFGVAPGTRLR